MKKYLSIIILSIILLFPLNVLAKEKVDVYLFHDTKCQHCQAEIKYLNEIKNTKNIEIHLYEVGSNKENATLMTKVKEQMKIKNQQVPFTVIGNTYYIGFEDSIKESMDDLIDQEIENPSSNVIDKILKNQDISDITISNGEIDKIITPIGTIDPNKVSLPVLGMIIGFIDGFNPCAMWVLIFLISMLFNMKDRKKMWILGITFLVSSALVYLLFMVAWLKVVTNLTSIVWFRLIVSLIALIGGIVNLRSYYKSIKKDSGCEVVDDKKRKKIFSSIKKITTEKSFLLAMGGIIILAVTVNVIELACSAGLPLIYTQILAINQLSGLEYAINILIYILFFLIDDIVIFVIAMITFNVTGISTKYTKYSHLVGGLLMIIISLLMAFKPEWLMLNF